MQKKIYFPNLDSLRFIAALMVFLEHRMAKLYGYSGINSRVAGKVWDLITDGYLGVILFFVLSGFLITYILLQEQEVTNHINIKNFYFRRILRIWPLYFLLVPLIFGVFPVLYRIPYILSGITHRLPYYITFLSNFDAIHIFKYHLIDNKFIRLMQTVTWSVSIEEQFYLVWPLLFLLLKAKNYIYIFIAAIALSLSFRVLAMNDSFVLPFHTLSVTMDLAIGGLAAYLVIKYPSFKDFFSKLPIWSVLTVYITGIGILLCREHIMYVVPYAKAFIHLFYGAFFAFVILHQNFSPDNFLKLGRYKALSFWGKYTYGIYLLHPVVIGIVSLFVVHYQISDTTFLNYLIIGVISFVLTLAISYLSYEFYEKKFLSLKKKFSVIVRD